MQFPAGDPRAHTKGVSLRCHGGRSQEGVLGLLGSDSQHHHLIGKMVGAPWDGGPSRINSINTP